MIKAGNEELAKLKNYDFFFYSDCETALRPVSASMAFLFGLWLYQEPA